MSFDIVVIGCSAGGIEVLKNILPQLDSSQSPPIVIVQHRGAEHPPILVSFFGSLCKLPVKEAESKEKIEKGHIYFAPAGYHLLVSDQQTFDLTVEEPVYFSRPSIDVLFESAAFLRDTKVLGIILTGANQDGAMGLKKIVQHGGTAIVQIPQDAAFDSMPRAALGLVPEAMQLTQNEIRGFLLEL